MSRRTRKSTAHWLIGTEDDRINGCKLPTARQVLRLFLHAHYSLGQEVRDSCRAAVTETIPFWQRANIPTRQAKHCVTKLEKMYNDWCNFKKSKSREGRSPSLDDKIKKFQNDLDALFDIAHQDALKIMKIPDDIEFLKSQRKKERQGSMSSVDMTLARKRTNKLRMIQTRVRQNEREAERLQTRFLAIGGEEIELGEHQATSENNKCDLSDRDYEVAPGPSSSVKRVKIINKHYLDMLERSQVTTRKASAISLTLAGNFGSNVVMSKSTLHRERVKNRQEYNEEKAIREIKSMKAIIIHWDGKILPDITGILRVDRLPVVASSGEHEKLLGVPKILTSTGLHQAIAVTDLVKKYEIKGQTVGMNFDTTASNTGKVKGCCTLVEEILGKKLLRLACRHHIHEVILGDVFHLCLGPNKGATFPLFERFRANWTTLDPQNFRHFEDESVITSVERNRILEFCTHQLQICQPRSDYTKLLTLTKVFLGASFPDGKSFGSPGALSDARWMAKANYCLTIFMFRDQLRLTKLEEKGVLRVCLFVVRVYVKFWFTCQVAKIAPRKDLELVQSLEKYASADKEVSKVGSDAAGRHFWYLGEHLVALSFFDEEVSIQTKRNMVKNIKERHADENPPPRNKLTKELTISKIAGQNLEDFVTTSTVAFFSIVGLSTTFLAANPCDWDKLESFIRTKEIVCGFRVVNDCAERGVALITQYTSAGLTKDETQLQYLIKIVEEHKKSLPKLDKSKVLAHMS